MSSVSHCEQRAPVHIFQSTSAPFPDHPIGQYEQLLLANRMTGLLKLVTQVSGLLILVNHLSSAAVEGSRPGSYLSVFHHVFIRILKSRRSVHRGLNLGATNIWFE